MTGTSYFLDSSVWLDYFTKASLGSVKLIEGNLPLLTSVVSLFEISKKLTKEGTKPAEVQKRLVFIKKICGISYISSEVAEKAAQDSIGHKLHTVDALIYRSALENKATLVTMDYDFHKLPGVKMIKQD